MSDGAGPRPVGRFFGGLLMAIGGLIAVTSGLCSLAVTAIGLGSNLSDASAFMTILTAGLPFLLGIGGIPFVIGLAMYFAGRSLYRRSLRAPGTDT
jgi:hypothetical protein